MKPIISVENLSKAYRIGIKEEVPDTIVGVAKNIAFSPISKLKRLRELQFKPVSAKKASSECSQEILWALRDVSFEIREGDVVGIVGRNGAGKSTLLKVLSRITEPTSGRAVLRGRVSSLLEVGTGFHPELTGRENVYMNGTILGMTKYEIDRKFDEIVDFSGIEKFLDTPTKRYSSGMQVRLAFSVAAHLEPEVLVIDEVLAVGDLEFQQRCLGKMNEVAKTGRTVLFVSHNMAAVENLCTSAIQLANGSVSATGTAKEIVASYRHNAFTTTDRQINPFSQCTFFKDVRLLDASNEETSHLTLGSRFKLSIDIHAPRAIKNPQIGIGIDTAAGERVLSLHTPKSLDAISLSAGSQKVECSIEHFPLAPGSYVGRFVLTERNEEIDTADNALIFSISDAAAFGEGRGFHRGVCVAPSKWSVNY